MWRLAGCYNAENQLAMPAESGIIENLLGMSITVMENPQVNLVQ